MRRYAAVLSLLSLPLAAIHAQNARLDSLRPGALLRQAMQAKAYDSVGVRTREWQRWAASAPESPAPRLALAMLARYDVRYGEGLAWVDSAARVARTPAWRSAVARERIGAQLTRGEFTGVSALVTALAADTAGLPAAELAEVRYVQLAYERRSSRKLAAEAIEAVAAIASPADSFMMARLDCMRAVADTTRMLEYANRAIAVATAAGFPFMVNNCQFVVATQYINHGQIGNALTWMVRAEDNARATHDDPLLAAALQWHGYALRTLGFVQSSRRRYTEAIRVSQRIGERNIEAWALLGIASSARAVGDQVTTSTALRRAAALFEATGDYLGSESHRLEGAQAQMMIGDLAGAERIATRSRIVGDSLSQVNLQLRSRYTLADIAMRRGQYDKVARLLDEAEPSQAKLGVEWSTQLRMYRGMLAQRRGDNTRAVALLTQARSEYSKMQELIRYNVDGALALAWLNTGDSARAARTLEDANRLLDAVRDTLAESGLRRVVGTPDFWGGTNDNVDRVMAAFVQSRRWLPTVFAVTERTRSRGLLMGTLASESAADSVMIREARRRVRATATVLSEVQRSLKPTTALLVYAGGRSSARTSLMVITHRTVRGLTLAPLDSLDRDIVRWLALLESGETGAGAGKRVANAVLGSALRGLPREVKRLVIVPHGPLYRVPFQALPFGDGVLGDRAVVTVSPSVSLALAYAAEPRSVQARVLALGAGDTQVSSSTPITLGLTVERSERSSPLAPLRAAADEARAAAAWGRGSVALTGPAASEAALKREAHGEYTVLHAAAHALTTDQVLGANYLILRADSTDDGYVSGGELSALSSGIAMVVLSGCRTTGDFGSRGDAIDGLVAPLLARGVRTVVASHWAVSDRWTQVLMERFYRNLAAGETTAAAMNNAQTSLRRSGVPARFWAAFSVIGDGALTFTSTTTAPRTH